MINIVLYQENYQKGIDLLMREIIEEFSLLNKHPTYQPKLPDEYWLALDHTKVIGTIGIIKVGSYGVLKRMFLLKEYRGNEKGIADLLLGTSIDWCRTNQVQSIYLGTLEKFLAAQKFYEKNGFRKIEQKELPPDFPHNPIDTLFYKLSLTKKN